jgi:hypothetical protein
MTIYCRVDFHARKQTVRYSDSETGEIKRQQLDHQGGDVRAFYSQFQGEVILGFEASGYSAWFEAMLEQLQRFSNG